MKTKILFTVTTFCIMLGFSGNVLAQENLNKVVDKAEKTSGVDVSVVHKKDKVTKETTKLVKSITFSNNKSLVDDFIKAFEKDKENAYQVIENKEQGKVKSYFFRFSGDKKADIIYSFNINDNGKGGNVSVIQK